MKVVSQTLTESQTGDFLIVLRGETEAQKHGLFTVGGDKVSLYFWSGVKIPDGSEVEYQPKSYTKDGKLETVLLISPDGTAVRAHVKYEDCDIDVKDEKTGEVVDTITRTLKKLVRMEPVELEE